MVDVNAGIVSCTVDQLPEWVREEFVRDTPYESIKQLTFFYHPKIDIVVLNSSHTNAEFYEVLVTTYLTVDDETRNEIRDNVPMEFIASAVDLLDYVIAERRRHAGH